MNFKKRGLIALGILVFLALMVLNVQLVQNPTGSGGTELTLVQLSASAGGEGSEGGSYVGFFLDNLFHFFWRVMYGMFGLRGA